LVTTSFCLNAAYFRRDSCPCVTPIPLLPQELIVLRFRVANVGYHGQIDGLFSQTFGGRRSANPIN